MKELMVFGFVYLLVTGAMFIVLRMGFLKNIARLSWGDEIKVFGFALLWPVIIYQGMKRGGER